MWDGLIQSVEGPKKETDSPKGEGILPANFHWTQIATFPSVFRLLAYPIDSGFASLHSCEPIPCNIALSLSHTHRHTQIHTDTHTKTHTHPIGSVSLAHDSSIQLFVVVQSLRHA